MRFTSQASGVPWYLHTHSHLHGCQQKGRVAQLDVASRLQGLRNSCVQGTKLRATDDHCTSMTDALSTPDGLSLMPHGIGILQGSLKLGVLMLQV